MKITPAEAMEAKYKEMVKEMGMAFLGGVPIWNEEAVKNNAYYILWMAIQQTKRATELDKQLNAIEMAQVSNRPKKTFIDLWVKSIFGKGE